MQKSTLIRFAALSALSASVAACSVFNGAETSGQYVDDTTITSKVKSDILADPTLRSSVAQIHVETLNGVVQLSGFVSTAASRAAAESVASNVKGVRVVKDDIIVRPTGN